MKNRMWIGFDTTQDAAVATADNDIINDANYCVLECDNPEPRQRRISPLEPERFLRLRYHHTSYILRDPSAYQISHLVGLDMNSFCHSIKDPQIKNTAALNNIPFMSIDN